jgi:hypothetical protein
VRIHKQELLTEKQNLVSSEFCVDTRVDISVPKNASRKSRHGTQECVRHLSGPPQRDSEAAPISAAHPRAGTRTHRDALVDGLLEPIRLRIGFLEHPSGKCRPFLPFLIRQASGSACASLGWTRDGAKLERFTRPQLLFAVY